MMHFLLSGKTGPFPGFTDAGKFPEIFTPLFISPSSIKGDVVQDMHVHPASNGFL